MKRIKTFAMFEVIKVPIKVGDTVLGGRFKNKKIVVKKIGKNDKGDITINGKPLLKFRIIRERHSKFKDLIELDIDWQIDQKTKQLIEDCLQDLVDDGFRVDVNIDFDEVSITKKGSEFKISEIEESLIDLSSHLKGIGVGANTIHYKITDIPYGLEDSMKAPQELDDGWRTERLFNIGTLSDVGVSIVEVFISQQQS